MTKRGILENMHVIDVNILFEINMQQAHTSVLSAVCGWCEVMRASLSGGSLLTASSIIRIICRTSSVF